MSNDRNRTSGSGSGSGSGTGGGSGSGSGNRNRNSRYRGGDGNMSGNGSGSSSGMSHEHDVDLIYSEDLADVDNDISLGRSNESDEGLSLGSVEFVYEDSQETIPKGYIDDAIVEEVINSADESLNNKKTCSIKKLVVYVIGTAAILAAIGSSLIVGMDSLEKNRIEQKIELRSSAFEFDDHDEFNSSVLGTEILPAGTNEVRTITGNSSIWETAISLGSETIFPSAIDTFLVDPHLAINRHETPLFWQVPFAGGGFQSYMSTCSNMVLASNHKKAGDDEIKIHNVGASRYVNVDLSTTEGIENAATKGLVEKGFADVIVSSHVRPTTSTLFDATHKGRLFTALRHPVDRSISEYHYVTTTTDDLDISMMTLKEYVSSKYIDNWITRFLVNKHHVPLVQEDLQLAKEILRRRCLVGLHEKIELSIKLFEQYFGWTGNGESITDAHTVCLKKVIAREHIRAKDEYKDVGNIEMGSAVYDQIVNLNKFDMKLYWYASDLFKEQESWVRTNREGL